MPTLDSLRACFRDTLVLPPDQIVDALSYQKDPVWDSVAHMRLVAAIEIAFNVMLTTEQILDISSFDKARDILRQHGIQLSN